MSYFIFYFSTVKKDARPSKHQTFPIKNFFRDLLHLSHTTATQITHWAAALLGGHESPVTLVQSTAVVLKLLCILESPRTLKKKKTTYAQFIPHIN